MKLLWIQAGADARSVVQPLPLPFRRMSKPIDPEIFRRQARGENVGRARLYPGTALRSRWTVGFHDDRGRVIDGRGLIFVISGRVELSMEDGSAGVLGPGDAYFQDDFAARGHRATCVGECRLLHLGVSDAWSPEGEVQTQATDGQRSGDGKPLLRRMFKAADKKSYFRDFAHLFPDPGQWSEPRPVAGFHFVQFQPGYCIGWDSEGVNNFVVIMTGKLELEVSGDGAI